MKDPTERTEPKEPAAERTEQELTDEERKALIFIEENIRNNEYLMRFIDWAYEKGYGLDYRHFFYFYNGMDWKEQHKAEIGILNFLLRSEKAYLYPLLRKLDKLSFNDDAEDAKEIFSLKNDEDRIEYACLMVCSWLLNHPEEPFTHDEIIPLMKKSKYGELFRLLIKYPENRRGHENPSKMCHFIFETKAPYIQCELWGKKDKAYYSSIGIKAIDEVSKYIVKYHENIEAKEIIDEYVKEIKKNKDCDNKGKWEVRRYKRERKGNMPFYYLELLPIVSKWYIQAVADNPKYGQLFVMEEWDRHKDNKIEVAKSLLNKCGGNENE